MKKNKVIVCLMALMALWLCGQASAELMAYEGFNYPLSPLGTQNGGYGWSAAWKWDTGASNVVIDPFSSMEQTFPAYTFNANMGRAYTNIAGVSCLGSRLLHNYIPENLDGTYYFSYIFEPRSTRYVILDFRLSATYSGLTMAYVDLDADPNVLHPAMELKFSETYKTSVDWALNERKFVVVKLVVSRDGPDQAFMKLYGESDTFDVDEANVTWDASISGTMANPINSFVIGTNTTSDAYFDELRVGTEWEDVVPGKSGFEQSEPLPGLVNSDPNLLAYEGFYYNGYNLDNGNGGFGWVGPWYKDCVRYPVGGPYTVGQLEGLSNIGIMDQEVFDMNNLLFDPMGGAVLESVPSVTSGMDYTFRQLDDASVIDLDTNDTYYISFLLRKHTTSSKAYFDFRMGQRGSNVYERVHIMVTGDNKYSLSIDNSTTTVTSAPSSFVPLQSYFIVVKITTQDSTEGNTDQMYLKAYTVTDTIDVTEPATWTLASSWAVNQSETLSVVRFLGKENQPYSFDELRIGKTWASVVAPQPMCSLPTGDFDGDCDVDLVDFSVFAGNWLID